ncbi:hypothetical protein V6N11_081385 [Hibiscus sabdariffa]|uniref:Uncharacterized protein n=1 Tax=Hibiscus sabdariffa TaxID=183260 RepID=A0ABR2QJU9_9ROSI
MPSVSLTPSTHYISRTCPTTFLTLLFLLSFAFITFSEKLSLSTAMTTSSLSLAEGQPGRFSSTTIKERYHTIVAAKNKWELQGFFLDDSLENYGLEPIIYKRLDDLS